MSLHWYIESVSTFMYAVDVVITGSWGPPCASTFSFSPQVGLFFIEQSCYTHLDGHFGMGFETLCHLWLDTSVPPSSTLVRKIGSTVSL
jgi:hypothetical protein